MTAPAAPLVAAELKNAQWRRATRSLEDIRADLEQAGRDLAALETGELTWQEYDETLRNGGLQDMAIEQAVVRLRELERELAHASAETPQ